MSNHSWYNALPPLNIGLGGPQQAAPFGPQMPQGLQMAGQRGGYAPPQQQQGGGFLGDMSGFEKAYLGASVIGGAASAYAGYRERKSVREEERRRYEQELEEERKHREAMGRNLSATWGTY